MQQPEIEDRVGEIKIQAATQGHFLLNLVVDLSIIIPSRPCKIAITASPTCSPWKCSRNKFLSPKMVADTQEKTHDATLKPSRRYIL